MTSNHEQDAFELRFESAVNEAHERSGQRSRPSGNVWKSIRAGLPDMQAETAEPRAAGVVPAPVSHRTLQRRKESGMDIALNPGMATVPPRANRGVFAWVAFALVGVLVASNLFWYGQTPSDNDGNELAWAPGLGTPVLSPQVSTDSSMCSVEPLTTDEVLETVLNPNKGYRRLGNMYAPNSDSLWEPELRLNQEYWSTSDLGEVEDPDRAEMLQSMGNEFWACIQHGSSYQVWSFIDPVVLQQIILHEFPVLRTQAELRSFIESVGPMPFLESGAEGFTSLAKFDAEHQATVIKEPGGLRFTDETVDASSGASLGIIELSDPDSFSIIIEMYVSEVSSGVWVVNDIRPATRD